VTDGWKDVSTVGITGSGPLSVTNRSGAQCFVPLSAFELNGSTVTLKGAVGADWATELAKTIDVAALTELAARRLAAGEVAAPPDRRVVPAILFQAQASGPEGNGIAVDVTPDGLDDVTIVAHQQLVYSGLASGAAAQGAIGDASGTGPMQVTAVGDGSAPPAPVVATTVTKGSDFSVNDAGGKLLFKIANAALDDVLLDVKVDAANPALFIVQIGRGPLTSTKVKLTDLGKSTGDASKLVKAATPSTGLAVPAAATVQLSGGGHGVAATGVAYSS
jgi:hypothetical protein